MTELLLNLPDEYLSKLAIGYCKSLSESDEVSSNNSQNAIDNQTLKKFIKSLSNDYTKIKQQCNKQNDDKILNNVC